MNSASPQLAAVGGGVGGILIENTEEGMSTRLQWFSQLDEIHQQKDAK